MWWWSAGNVEFVIVGFRRNIESHRTPESPPFFSFECEYGSGRVSRRLSFHVGLRFPLGRCRLCSREIEGGGGVIICE